MNTTPEFMDAVKTRLALPSDYALAPVLGITRASVSRFRNGKDAFGDATAMRVAELLGIDPGFVIACAHRERAKTDAERAVWTAMLEKLGGLAAALLLAPALLLATTESNAQSTASSSQMQMLTIFRTRRVGILAEVLAALFRPRHAAP